jgi:S-methylmethionine-dependent homocysteine/selenocysteine methylase
MPDRPGLLLLDGATGTELARRGFDTHGPAWSAPAIVRSPEVLASIHEEHALAGADVITANTFRTQRRALARIGEGRRAREWTSAAVRIAREAADRAAASRADGRPILVAGSVAPLEDSYSPELAPDEATALAEHREHVGHLAEAGVDLLLVETMTTVAESRAATRAAAETGLETWTSVTTDAPGGHLLSGESLVDWSEAVAPLRPAAMLVNCVAPDAARTALGRVVPLASAIEALPGAYANLGSAEPPAGGGVDIAMGPEQYAEAVRGLLDAGARIVGGCCGTTPEHTKALRALLDERMAADGAVTAPAEAAWRALIGRAASLAGGGRALVVRSGDGSDGVAPGDRIEALARYDVLRVDPGEWAHFPRDAVHLAVVDGPLEVLAAATRALVAGGWLAARLQSDVDERPAETLAREGFEILELDVATGETLVLARRPG